MLHVACCGPTVGEGEARAGALAGAAPAGGTLTLNRRPGASELAPAGSAGVTKGANAGEPLDVLVGFFVDDVDHVVDGQHPDQPFGVVHDGGR